MDLARTLRRLMLAAAVLLAGCGGGTNSNDPTLRLLNASTGYSSLDLYVDDARAVASQAAGSASDALAFDKGAHTLALRSAGGSTTLATSSPSLAKSTGYTLVAYGGQGKLATVLLQDADDAPGASSSRLRLLNGAPEVGAVDVYLSDSCATASDFSGAIAVASALATGANSGWVDSGAGGACLRVTGAGNTSDLRLVASGLNFGGGQNITIVLTSGSGGVLVQAYTLVQGGALATVANPSARVRLAAGVPSKGVVAASIGGVTLSAGLTSPAVGTYALVDAGSAAVSLTIDGTAASSTASLAAGADYTLVVGGSGAFSLIADNNALPSPATSAKLRLVHGLPSLSASSLGLTADAATVGGETAYLQGSSYGTVTPGTSIVLDVSAAGVQKTDQTLVAGAVYTLFVLGGETGSPSGLLRRDR